MDDFTRIIVFVHKNLFGEIVGDFDIHAKQGHVLLVFVLSRASSFLLLLQGFLLHDFFGFHLFMVPQVERGLLHVQLERLRGLGVLLLHQEAALRILLHSFLQLRLIFRLFKLLCFALLRDGETVLRNQRRLDALIVVACSSGAVTNEMLRVTVVQSAAHFHSLLDFFRRLVQLGLEGALF